jgi:hypothetical protein
MAYPLKKAARVVVQCLVDLLFDRYRMGRQLDTEMCFHIAVRPFPTLLPSFLCLFNLYELQQGCDVIYEDARIQS